MTNLLRRLPRSPLSSLLSPPYPIIAALLLWVALAVSASPARADDDHWGSFGLSFGYYDFDDPLEAFELGVDYGFAPIRWGLVPYIGVHGTEDETFFGYVGLRRDFALGSRWLLTAGLAVSLHEPGDGKDLGHVVEFRSGLDFGLRLGNGGRVGFGFYHLSNSSISGINPGANSLLLRYLFPPRRKAGSR